MITNSIFAQIREKYTYGFSIGYTYGFLINHYPHMKNLVRGPVSSFESALILQTKGTEDWHKIHNYPRIMVNYAYFNFSNPEQIGSVHNIFPSVELTTTRSDIFFHNMIVGVGLGYIEKPYDRISNNKNAAIGSHFNGMVRVGTQIGIQLEQRFKLSAALLLNHWSNGASKVPNLGFNVPSVMFKADYLFEKEDFSRRKKKVPDYENTPMQYYISLMGATKQVEPIGTGNFLTGTLQFSTRKNISHKNAFGGGIDFFFNEGIRQNMLNIEEDFSTINYFRAGIHLSHEFRMGNVATLVNAGYYIFKLDKLNKNHYNRIGFRYYLSENVHFNLSLKSHLFVADHFEYGFGFKIK